MELCTHMCREQGLSPGVPAVPRYWPINWQISIDTCPEIELTVVIRCVGALKTAVYLAILGLIRSQSELHRLLRINCCIETTSTERLSLSHSPPRVLKESK